MPRRTCLQDPKIDSEQSMIESKHFFESKELRGTFVKRWRLLAGMFKDYKNILGYDLFNEPAPVTVDSILSDKFDTDIPAYFYEKVIKEIRSQDQGHETGQSKRLDQSYMRQ